MMFMNYGMTILHQPIDIVGKMPLPFMFRSYREFMGTVTLLFHSLNSNELKMPQLPQPKKGREDQLKIILKEKKPPESWFNKRIDKL